MDLDISNKVLVDANHLKNNGIQKRQIKEHVVAILRKINDELREAHMEGKHVIITQLPIIFDISNMNLHDSRRAVWATIISTLRCKNYRVWICSSNDDCKLKITWISEEDELLLQNQKQILSKHTASF
jgi:hypothetical protein